MRKTSACHKPGWTGLWCPVLLLLIGSFVAASAGFGQVVENTARPRAANAGRVVTPEQVAVISDEGTSDFYFKWPRDLRIGPSGSLLLTDESQILQFDANGKFLRNLFKKGQGPGEMTYPGACLAAGKGLVVFSANARKLVFFGASGRFEREAPVPREGRAMLTLLHYLDGIAYFASWEFPRTSGDPDFVDNPRTIVAVGETGAVKKLAAFVTRAWVVTSAGGGGGGMFDVTRLVAIPCDGPLLALTHTEEYLIKIYDPVTDQVVRQFRRAYERVAGRPLTEAEKKGGIFIDNKNYTRPELKFENDIQNLLSRAGEVWGVTSTRDKAKGVLVDVFDREGVYQDCFWLKLPEAALGSLMAPGRCVLDGDFLWVVEQGEDETSSIKKYRIAR